MCGPSGMWAAASCPSCCTPRGLVVMIMAVGLEPKLQTARQGSAVAIASCMVARPSSSHCRGAGRIGAAGNEHHNPYRVLQGEEADGVHLQESQR